MTDKYSQYPLVQKALAETADASSRNKKLLRARERVLLVHRALDIADTCIDLPSEKKETVMTGVVLLLSDCGGTPERYETLETDYSPAVAALVDNALRKTHDDSASLARCAIMTGIVQHTTFCLRKGLIPLGHSTANSCKDALMVLQVLMKECAVGTNGGAARMGQAFDEAFEDCAGAFENFQPAAAKKSAGPAAP